MRHPTAWLVAAAGLASAGCATVLDGSRQPISVETRAAGQPLAGVRCQLKNERGEVWITTPDTALVPSDNGDLRVACRGTGVQPRDETARSELNGKVLGNVLVGGLIGFGLDHAGGAAWRYPDTIVVDMVPLPAAAAARDPRAGRLRVATAEASVAAGALDLSRTVELVRRVACEPARPPELLPPTQGASQYRVACADGRSLRAVCLPSECRFRAAGD